MSGLVCAVVFCHIADMCCPLDTNAITNKETKSNAKAISF